MAKSPEQNLNEKKINDPAKIEETPTLNNDSEDTEIDQPIQSKWQLLYKKIGPMIIIIVITVILGFLSSFGYSLYHKYFTSIREITIPQIIGFPEERAIIALKDRGLKGISIGTRETLSGNENIVLEVIPEVGTAVKANRRVKYVLSKLKQTIIMPSFISLSLPVAQNMINESRLSLNAIEEAFSDQIDKGNILSQTPSAGCVVSLNSLLALTVSKGSPVELTLRPLGTELAHIGIKVKFSIPQGWTPRVVKVVSSGKDYEETIYKQEHKAGDIMLLDFEDQKDNTIRVFFNRKMVAEQTLNTSMGSSPLGTNH